MNLNNIVEAALGVDADTKRFQLVLRAEAETVYRAAGITWVDPGSSHAPRAHLMQHGAVEGVSRAGSTTQSLARALGSVETDYLNGEIVLLGRLHGVPVPANSYFVDLSARMVCDGLEARVVLSGGGKGGPHDSVEGRRQTARVGPFGDQPLLKG